MIGKIHRPDVFFRQVHPEDSKGNIILGRTIKSKKHFSQVSPKDAEKVCKLSCLVEDVGYSIACFSGLPHLLNFESTRCLYIQFNYSPEIKEQVYKKLDRLGFNHPTAIVMDGEKYTFFWMLKDVIKRQDFHKVYLLQSSLFLFLESLNPCKDSLRIDALVSLIGTKKSSCNKLVVLLDYNGEYLSNEFAENYLLSKYSIPEFERLQKHALAVLELLAIFQDRIMCSRLDPEELLILFGASLCHFCTRDQLKSELKALIESIENMKWKVLNDVYKDLINSIASTAIDGYISYKGKRINITVESWFVDASVRLKVSDSEIRRLGLTVICGRDDVLGNRFNPMSLLPVGEVKFVPVERLLLKQVS